VHRPVLRAALVRLIASAAMLILAGACGGSRSGDLPAEATMTGSTFSISSSEISEGGRIPRRFTCDGPNTSPPLSWAGAPSDAKALALILDDPDANGFVHWVLFNVEATATGSLPTGFSASPDAPPQGMNGAGGTGYTGPCPPSGTHRYNFRLLALDEMLPLAGTPRSADVLVAAEGHVLAEARLAATYQRGG
jgi:Raf kinase inhibitor-like YbhB/YbcL family protein